MIPHQGAMLCTGAHAAGVHADALRALRPSHGHTGEPTRAAANAGGGGCVSTATTSDCKPFSDTTNTHHTELPAGARVIPPDDILASVPLKVRRPSTTLNELIAAADHWHKGLEDLERCHAPSGRVGAAALSAALRHLAQAMLTSDIVCALPLAQLSRLARAINAGKASAAEARADSWRQHAALLLDTLPFVPGTIASKTASATSLIQLAARSHASHGEAATAVATPAEVLAEEAARVSPAAAAPETGRPPARSIRATSTRDAVRVATARPGQSTAASWGFSGLLARAKLHAAASRWQAARCDAAAACELASAPRGSTVSLAVALPATEEAGQALDLRRVSTMVFTAARATKTAMGSALYLSALAHTRLAVPRLGELSMLGTGPRRGAASVLGAHHRVRRRGHAGAGAGDHNRARAAGNDEPDKLHQLLLFPREEFEEAFTSVDSSYTGPLDGQSSTSAKTSRVASADFDGARNALTAFVAQACDGRCSPTRNDTRVPRVSACCSA